MDVRKLCMNCMCETLDEAGHCLSCGLDEDSIKTTGRHLPMRKILKGKYLIGRVLGEGGFGITYIGFDMDLEIRVAIKEFCPREYAGREITDGTTILPYDEDSTQMYEEEMEKYINEAKRLAKFRNQDGVVSVLDYFRENNTAYIVMDYIDGVTLKNYAKALGRPMPYEQVLTLIHPVIKALQVIHKNGMMHRDISPDNIMITHDGSRVYLIDFGTARNMQNGTLSVYKKSFYTPLEQQSEKGNQGPWTDVYALCATMYQCITGKGIPMATDRVLGESIVLPNKMGIAVPEAVELALAMGMTLEVENRIQDMEELEKELYIKSEAEGREDELAVNDFEEEYAEGCEDESKENYEDEDIIEDETNSISTTTAPRTGAKRDVNSKEGFKALKRWRDSVNRARGALLVGNVFIAWCSIGIFYNLLELSRDSNLELRWENIIIFGVVFAVIFIAQLISAKKILSFRKEIFPKVSSVPGGITADYAKAQIEWLKNLEKKTSGGNVKYKNEYIVVSKNEDLPGWARDYFFKYIATSDNVSMETENEYMQVLKKLLEKA